MTPAALVKAEALARHIKHLGCRQSEFELYVSPSEAQELLDWLPASGLVDEYQVPLLEQDIAQARRAKDPWIVLGHFLIGGFKSYGAPH